MRRPGPDEWNKLISEFEQSQLTQKAFCAEKDVTLSTSQCWLYKRSKLGSKFDVNSRHAFVPVEIVASPASKTRAGDGLVEAAPNFTEKQGQYLAFIYAYTRVQGRPPAEADLQRFFRVSPPTVHQMILTLESNEFIRRTPGMARSIELIVAPEILPILREPIKTTVERY